MINLGRERRWADRPGAVERAAKALRERGRVKLTKSQFEWLSKLSQQAWCIPKRVAVRLLALGLVRISVHCDEVGHYPVAITDAGRAAVDKERE